MTTLLGDDWTPTPRQAEFLSCPCYEVLYGGAKGGGKTDAMLRMHLAQLKASEERFAKTGKKSRGWAVFFRKTFPQLDEVIARSLLIFPAFGAHYKSDQHCWVFPSGYRFQFAHLENDGSEVAWHGKEITLLMIDQAEEITEKQYLFLKMQVRTADPVLRPLLGVRISANPIGRYVDWIKERFIGKHYDGGHVFVDEFTLKDGRTVTRDRVYIKATLYDNPHVNAEYEADLLGLPPDQREAYLYGRWDVYIGTFFSDCWVPSVHVIPPVEISPHWEVFRMADWGSSAPAACYWAAIDQDGDIIIFDELYGPGKTGTAWGKKILEVEALYGDRFVERDHETRKVIGSKLQGPIDWAANTSNGAEGPTVVEAMHNMGIYWFPADKRRKEGAVEVRDRLMKRTTERKPGLRIVSHCEHLIRTLPKLVSDEKDPDDIAHGAKKQEDHAYDALRYGMMSRPVSAEDPETHKMTSYQRAMYDRAAAKLMESLEDSRDDVTGY